MKDLLYFPTTNFDFVKGTSKRSAGKKNVSKKPNINLKIFVDPQLQKTCDQILNHVRFLTEKNYEKNLKFLESSKT